MTAGSVLLVTGAAHGIGAAIARAGAKRGYRLFLHYHASASEAKVLAAELAGEGHEASLHQSDLADANAAEDLVAAAITRYGRLDALVNNAGLSSPSGPVADLVSASLDRFYRVNFAATVLMSQQALFRMEGGGAIVNISSTAAIGGGRGVAVYAAMKAAVNSFTQSFAREAAEHGVRVNAVMPGLIEAGGHANLDAQTTAERVASVPLGRFGRPEEVADAVMWLLSADAAYISGAVLPVHGAR